MLIVWDNATHSLLPVGRRFEWTSNAPVSTFPDGPGFAVGRAIDFRLPGIAADFTIGAGRPDFRIVDEP